MAEILSLFHYFFFLRRTFDCCPVARLLLRLSRSVHLNKFMSLKFHCQVWLRRLARWQWSCELPLMGPVICIKTHLMRANINIFLHSLAGYMRNMRNMHLHTLKSFILMLIIVTERKKDSFVIMMMITMIIMDKKSIQAKNVLIDSIGQHLQLFWQVVVKLVPLRHSLCGIHLLLLHSLPSLPSLHCVCPHASLIHLWCNTGTVKVK